MEVMEDGNLMDKVHILIQRDMEFYKSKQSILQETICPGIVGGRLDFPRSTSFAAMKLVLWWEEEYMAAYRKSSGFVLKNGVCEPNLDASGGCGGIVKASDPTKFVALISKTAEQLLEHLHILSQEALDHADLTVLTGTIGAAALLKNCLWCYMQSMHDNNKENPAESLQATYKAYQEMGEALAERLLDLHCRLLSLYILQEAESLNWEDEKSFCESERGSYVIQMWWLYMQGMLNESLTILTVRYTQSCPSEARSQLLIVDISNLLLCTAQLLSSICDKGEEFIGLNLNNKNKILRDIHTKCQELLNCMLLRGASLDILQKVFRKGIENVELFKSKTLGPAPWITFALSHIFRTSSHKNVLRMSDFEANIGVAVELTVLLAQPQPNWALLLKVLCMKQCKVLKLILDLAADEYNTEMQKPNEVEGFCGHFLCTSDDGSCRSLKSSDVCMTQLYYYSLLGSATNVVLSLGNLDDFSEIIFTSITKNPHWANCLDRRQVWNQIRPPWYESILSVLQPLLSVISKTVINAVQTGASTYQAMLIILACFSQLWDCVDNSLPKIANLIQDLLPANITPLSHSALIQILISALYSDLLQVEQKRKNNKQVNFDKDQLTGGSVAASPSGVSSKRKDSSGSFDPVFKSEEEIGLAVAEALCSIDEDNKHTDQIEDFLEQVRDNLEMFGDLENDGVSRVEQTEQITEVIVSDILMTKHGKSSLKTLHHFIKNNSEWLFQRLGVSDAKELSQPNKITNTPSSLLHTMFHIGYHPFDQLLIGEWKPNWTSLIQTPMGLSVDRVWAQISLRCEFRDINSTSLSSRDVQIVNSLSSLFKTKLIE